MGIMMIEKPGRFEGRKRAKSYLASCAALGAITLALIASGCTSENSSSVASTGAAGAPYSENFVSNAPLNIDVNRDFPEWLERQTQASYAKLLTNISRPETARGVVIASPSRNDPDYFFHWTRDAALVMDVIGKDYAASAGRARQRWFSMMDDYVTFSRGNQLSNAMTGLGEPKFNVDGSPYMGPWGRPQNDGPALRAVTLIRFARELIKEGNSEYVRTRLYDSDLPARTVIKADLEFVANHWHEASFCLWEEVRGDHFYTRIVQLVSMEMGAQLARELGDGGAAAFYDTQARRIRGSLENFWDGRAGMIKVTRDRVEGIDYKVSGLDTAVILGVLHAGYMSGPWSVADSRVLATAQKLEEGFRVAYPVNDPTRFADVGVALGRYPEDRYSGKLSNPNGNPWVLTTAAMAELHYKLAKEIANWEDFTVDNVNAEFVRGAFSAAKMDRTIEPGMKFAKGSTEMNDFLTALTVKGDQFMKRVRLHGNPDGSLSEQIDRNSGYMTSAEDLTWSHASIITANAARKR